MSSTHDRSRVIRRALVVIGVLVVAAVAWSGYQVWSSWNEVERVAFDPDTARDAFEDGSTTTNGATGSSVTTSTVAADNGTTTTTVALPETLLLDRTQLNTFLVIGTDDSDRRADVILLVMLPPNTGDAVMVSLPRDLYIPNPCLGGARTKINQNMWGCQGVGVTGPEQLAVAVEDFTGVPIDHFIKFNFFGFTRIIDRIGGVEVCVGDQAVRDLNEDFEDFDQGRFQLPAGCSTVDGETALAWMRSRRTQVLTDSGWRTMEGVNDLTRNERQREMLLTALDELKQVRSLPELQGIVDDVSNAFVIDEGLGLGDAIALLWDARTISSDDIYQVELDVFTSTTEEGASILLLNTPFQDTLLEAYPRAVDIVGWAE